jgi:NuA3 HAT complex component NTO1
MGTCKFNTAIHTSLFCTSESYPFWPAVVYEPDTPNIPKAVLNVRRTVVRKELGPLHLVQFYDKSSSWCVQSGFQGRLFMIMLKRQWLEPSKLYLLGDDEGFDGDMLNVRGKAPCRVMSRLMMFLCGHRAK